MKRGGLLCAFPWLLACGAQSEALAPYGEVLVEVDTNLRVPQAISRVRFDLFDAEQRWLQSRDFPTPEPSDFPLSFSIYDDATSRPRTAYLRVRGYTDAHVRDYLGERFEERVAFEAPTTQTSLRAACADAPPLEVGEVRNLRLRGQAFADGGLSCAASAGDFEKRTASGLAVFRLPIADPGRYRVSVVTSSPGVEWAPVADTLLSLRTACADVDSELACNDDELVGQSTLSGLTYALEPGDYFVLIGNVAPGPMDVGVYVQQRDVFSNVPTDVPGELTRDDPRLIVDGVDLTPPSEPEPYLAVDRLARIDVEAGVQRAARLLLDGECLGTMADLRGLRSCVSEEGELVDVEAEPLDAGRSRSGGSAVGGWSKYEHPGCAEVNAPVTPGLFDERVCVSGGAFLLGDSTLIDRGADGGYPERLAVIPSLFVDRYEYTVGRYRAARARGFEPPDGGPLNNFEGFLPSREDLTRACTYSESLDGSPRFPEQEDLPLSCVSWLSARALCELDGGRLPTVAEREYLASAAGRDFETAYPWGERKPSCNEALFGRWYEPTYGSTECARDDLVGPAPVNAEPWASFDVTPEGVVGLGGSLAEWTADSHRAYSDPCFESQPHFSPRCDEAEAPLRTIAGGSWRSPAAETRAASRSGGAVAGIDPWVGFRCVYEVPQP
ncbi:MAG: Adenylate cyclase [Polyangiaceae bacterium]|nr:Adenylate cyclase [Polyangiaceae bacterium]